MNSQNKKARRFGRILEDGYQKMEADVDFDTGLRDSVIQATMFRSAAQRNKKAWAGAIAFAGAAAILIAVFVKSASPLSFSIDGSTRLEGAGYWVQTERDEQRVVHFADGSEVVVTALTDARIVDADTKNVTLDLNRGVLKLHVMPHRNNQWTVRTGPYRVHVVGTKFRVAWHVEADALQVSVTKGRVWVEGPGIDKNGIYVAAGNQLQVQDTMAVSIGPISHPAMQATKKAGSSQKSNGNGINGFVDAAEIADGGSDTVALPPTAKTSTAPMPIENWQRFANAKKYDNALIAARTVGIRKLSKTLPAGDLWLLANTARYSGASDDAVLLFTAHRKRFPTNAKSKTAAFLLSEIGSTHQKDTLQARKWLKTYLRESPNGALHEEALGRLMRLSAKPKQSADAHGYATAYLKQYPTGLFAQQARRILQDKASDN